jgi:hypothetical protein
VANFEFCLARTEGSFDGDHADTLTQRSRYARAALEGPGNHCTMHYDISGRLSFDHCECGALHEK